MGRRAVGRDPIEPRGELSVAAEPLDRPVRPEIRLLRNIPCIDIRQQCTGFLYGITIADQFIRTGAAKHALVIGSEIHSTGLDVSTVRYGLIAQECETVMPELVKSEAATVGEFSFDDMRSFDPTNITYALINAVKTLTERVKALEAQLAAPPP